MVEIVGRIKFSDKNFENFNNNNNINTKMMTSLYDSNKYDEHLVNETRSVSGFFKIFSLVQ